MTDSGDDPHMPAGWQPAARFTSSEAEALRGACAEVLEHASMNVNACLRLNCEHRAACWPSAIGKPASDVLPRLPWVGPSYRPGGTVAVGMNAHTHAGLLDETYAVEAAANQLARGRKRFFGQGPRSPSWFHYRAAISATLVDDALVGNPAQIREPEDVASALLRTARLQAVQCAPAGSARRTPTSGMWRHCPPLLAWPTLHRLRPGAVVLFGNEVRDAFERHHAVQWTVSDRLLRFGHAPVAGSQVAVFALRHPSSGFGMRSNMALQGLLNDPSTSFPE